MKQAKANQIEIEDTLALIDKIQGSNNPDLVGRVVIDFIRRHPGTLNRIVYGYQNVVENACDPDKPYLDWRPELKDFFAETTAILHRLDELAEQWGDEACFRRCRDNLREALGKVKPILSE